MSNNNNFFSSLKNTASLFNSLDINNELTLKYFNKLVNDFSNLLYSSDYYDVEIKVGREEDSKVFKAHAIILKTRSLYFRTALSNNWIKKSNDGIILFEKENISPRVFEVLLMYVYNGIINIDNLEGSEILELLEACDELCFNELIEGLQNYVIYEKNEWLCENLIYAHKISSKHQLFNLLQDYCNDLIREDPESILQSNNLKALEKSILRSILLKDVLNLNEIDIWNCIIQWGIGQNEALEKNISEWNNGDFKKMKKILDGIILLIRFSDISKENFFEKIKPYEKIFDEKIYNELLLQYQFARVLQPRFLQKGPRTKIERGKLLSLKMKILISAWIGRNNGNAISHGFQLILQGTRDGFSRSVFMKKCHNIEQTIVLMKIKETGELVGGYNPVCWNIKGRSPNEWYSIETDQSFIFKINENEFNKSILSRVKIPRHAIIHNGQDIDRTLDNIKFHETSISFCHLALFNSNNNEPYCYYLFSNYTSYKNYLNLRKYDKYVQLLEECEVYKLVKKN